MPDPEKPIAGAYDHEYFRGLTSEKVQTRFSKGHPIREWHKPPGARNEPLDRRAYALAVLYSRSVPWEILARSAPVDFNPTKEETTSAKLSLPMAPMPQGAAFTRPIRGRFRGR
jgi:phage terminase large subunit GpA-like protein